MDKIVPSFESSLFDPSLKDVVIDAAEAGIDGVLDEGLVSDIPILRTIVGVGKTAQNIRDRNLMRQTVAFINEFNEETIPTEKLRRYRRKLDENPRFAEEELGRVLVVWAQIKRSTRRRCWHI